MKGVVYEIDSRTKYILLNPVDMSRNSETGGYGIGLSIAQSIVNAHKGSITASTEDEKSLTIQITL